DVLAAIKDRGPLMGACMDVGHTVEIGVDPVECIERCGDRLHDMHIKDISQAAKGAKTVELGQGIIDIVGILKALSGRKYPYHVGLEHEANADNPQPYVMECAGYLRGVAAAMA